VVGENDPLWRLPATELGRCYRARTLSPVDVVHSVLARIDTANPRINAVIARRDAAVLAEAAASERRFAEGRAISPLDGVPLTVKDSLYWRDLPTTCGTPALRSHQPGHDELAATRAHALGALVLGKTNVPEFANEGHTANPLFGVTGNPWNPALTSGGSSGGAAAAVAAGFGPLAIAQDGGGSIRRPASHTGLVGLKPSLGAWPRQHALPSTLLDFEVIGPMARTVADCQLLFSAVRDFAPRTWAPPGAADRQSRDVLHLRYVERLDGNPLDPQIALSCRRAVNRLAALGCAVEEGPLPFDVAFLTEAWPEIGQIGLAAAFNAHPDWEAQCSPRYQQVAASGRAIGAPRLWQITEWVRRLRRDVADGFEPFDAIVTPAAAALPWPAAEAFPTVIEGRAVGPRGHAVYTGWVNAAGLPALALPCEPSSEGLPIGIQVIGAHGHDDRLLRLGAAYEAAAPWARRWPAL
jgi:aspartyl-tRNA(Asn)/glutamyl-tRNA(Gln) amidotransferase subunit A